MKNKIEIVDVMRNYSLRVGTIDTYPNYYKLKTNYGPKIVNKWKDETSINKAHSCRELLVREGFRKIDRFIPTKEGNPYAVLNNIGYSLTDEVFGRLPSLDSMKDIKIISSTLAKFHQALFKIETKSDFNPWSVNYSNGLIHINKIEDSIKHKSNKIAIDNLVLKDIAKSKEQIKQSIEMAQRVEKIAVRNESQPKLCHGNLYLSSFLIDEYDEGWIIDLNNPTSEMPSYDLARFVSRIYKDNNCTDEVIYKFLDYYQEIIPLKTEDKLWILTYIAYPHDLWKFLYIHYVVKVTQTNNVVKEYQILSEQMFRLLGLYQNLFNYFKI
ncbi:MAG: hypothetical protein AB7V16_03150 [Vulcanibacillus sp.]